MCGIWMSVTALTLAWHFYLMIEKVHYWANGNFFMIWLTTNTLMQGFNTVQQVLLPEFYLYSPRWLRMVAFSFAVSDVAYETIMVIVTIVNAFISQKWDLLSVSVDLVSAYLLML